MGQIKNIKCSVCGNEWQQYIGAGFAVTYYHCDKCNKELIANNSDYVDRCECGGTFGVDVLMCPLCLNVPFDVDVKIVAMWD